MAATQGTSGFGTLLKRGDGGAGGGTKASRTIGTVNAQIVIRWGLVGTAGNSKTCSIVVAGNLTPLTVTVTTSAITINSATDAGGLATSTVNDVISALNENTVFNSNWEADNGAGTGTSVVIAAASAALSGGTASGELFTTIAEITNITGPEMSLETIDATHMESTNGFREYIPSLKDSGELSFDFNFLPADANQTALYDDMLASVRRNFQIVWTDAAPTTYSFAGYVKSLSYSAQIDDKLSGSGTVQITGPISIS